eukprot:m.191462 g.191462  ORF g.191462 m.191462 type:complete len:312 (+) comp18348_c0_seq1:70-1005(+)
MMRNVAVQIHVSLIVCIIGLGPCTASPLMEDASSHIVGRRELDTISPTTYYSGIPRQRDVIASFRGSLFQSMEAASNEWIATNGDILAVYQKKWVLDSFHWWSRVWEYPYVYHQIHTVYQSHHDRILDMGAGVSFFPWYIKSKFPHSELIASDYDKRFPPWYDAINKRLDASLNVPLLTSDLRSAFFPNASCDIVYSVSVLEHTDNYQNVIANVKRILKPGGYFIVTIDISLDNKRSIPFERAKELLAHLKEEFEDVDDTPTITKNADVLLPLYAIQDPDKYAWFPKDWPQSPPQLTVSCNTFRKRLEHEE